MPCQTVLARTFRATSAGWVYAPYPPQKCAKVVKNALESDPRAPSSQSLSAQPSNNTPYPLNENQEPRKVCRIALMGSWQVR